MKSYHDQLRLPLNRSAILRVRRCGDRGGVDAADRRGGVRVPVQAVDGVCCPVDVLRGQGAVHALPG